MRRTAGALLLCLAGCGARPGVAPVASPPPPLAAEPSDWRRLATPADRDRLRRWRDAWVTALAQARDAAGPALITHGALPHGLVDRHLWLRDGRLSEAAPAAGR